MTSRVLRRGCWFVSVLTAVTLAGAIVPTSAVVASEGRRCCRESRRARVVLRRDRRGRCQTARVCVASPAPNRSSKGDSRPEVIAHRGASAQAPENTLASVRLAWQQHADAVEIDVYLSRDGEIVVYHDRTTKRIGGRDRPVQEQTLAELRQLDVGAWKGPEFAGERIPTLEQILSTVPAGKRLFIEVKSGVEMVPVLVSQLEHWKQAPNSAVVIAFAYDVAERIKRLMPGVPVYWLIGFERDEATGAWRPSLGDVLTRARRAGFEGIDVNDTALVDEQFVREVHNSGLSLFVWTVNDQARAEELARFGVDGITTDVPAMLLRRLTDQSRSRCKQ